MKFGGPIWMTVLALAGALASRASAETGTRTIYLIRHGEYDHDDPREDDVGKGLTPLGIAQARMTAARLKELPFRIDSITSSTLTRARETARVIGQDFPDLAIEASPLLSECTPATWRKDIMEREKPEDLEACAKQLDEAFATFFVPSPDGDRHDVLVCHGNVTRYFVTKALGVDTMAWLNMNVGNGSITEIVVRKDGSTKVMAVGDVGHIPPNLRSGHDSADHNLVVPEAKPE